MRNCIKIGKCTVALLLVLALLKFSSCDQASTNSEKLIGTWKVTIMDFNGKKTAGSSLGDPQIIFKEGGIFITSMAGKENSRNWKVEGDVIHIMKDSDKQELNIESLDGDELEYWSEDKNGKLIVKAVRIDGN